MELDLGDVTLEGLLWLLDDAEFHEKHTEENICEAIKRWSNKKEERRLAWPTIFMRLHVHKLRLSYRERLGLDYPALLMSPDCFALIAQRRWK